MIPQLPYLQNAVMGYHREFIMTREARDQDHYIQWMKDQGVMMPMLSYKSISFTDKESELLFVLRWA